MTEAAVLTRKNLLKRFSQTSFTTFTSAGKATHRTVALRKDHALASSRILRLSAAPQRYRDLSLAKLTRPILRLCTCQLSEVATLVAMRLVAMRSVAMRSVAMRSSTVSGELC